MANQLGKKRDCYTLLNLSECAHAMVGKSCGLNCTVWSAKFKLCFCCLIQRLRAVINISLNSFSLSFGALLLFPFNFYGMLIELEKRGPQLH